MELGYWLSSEEHGPHDAPLRHGSEGQLLGGHAPTIPAARRPPVAARIDRMFRTALGRAPEKAESARVEQAVKSLAALHNVSDGEVLKSKAVWQDVAHDFFNMKEFIYVR